MADVVASAVGSPHLDAHLPSAMRMLRTARERRRVGDLDGAEAAVRASVIASGPDSSVATRQAHHLAMIRAAADRTLEAIFVASCALAHAETSADKSRARLALCWIYKQIRDWPLAAQEAREALLVADDGSWEEQAALITLLSLWAEARAISDDYAHWLLTAYRELNVVPSLQPAATWMEAAVACMRGDGATAEHGYRQAAQAFAEVQDWVSVASVVCDWARLHLLRGQHSEALRAVGYAWNAIRGHAPIRRELKELISALETRSATEAKIATITRRVARFS